MQHFKVKMECGHFYQVSAVSALPDGKPYDPNYVGQVMPSRCCQKSHKVTQQEVISHVVGQPHIV